MPHSQSHQPEHHHPPGLVLSIDQGTSSTRVVAYDSTGRVVASHQTPLAGIFPQQGWVEQDPLAILATVEKCLHATAATLKSKGYTAADVRSIGVTNQRETTIVWDPITGTPLYNAIVWLDARTTETVEALVDATPTKDKTALQSRCGLPLSTYFSAVKLRWLLDNVLAIREEARAGRCFFGTVDSWLIWNLTGGVNGGVHVTDVTNASRTMLMNINSLQWDPELCSFFGVPMTILPEIRSSAEVYGTLAAGPLAGVPIAGCLGDQHAALLGQHCLSEGEAKNTYGTGCFLLYNTGTTSVLSRHGLLTTVAFKLGPTAPVTYALEGAVAIAGEGVRWLRDQLGIIASAAEVEAVAGAVDGTHGVYFVPAFSGLLAPYWRHDARGTIVGLTQYSNKHHIARAMLEAVCFQTRELLEAMNRDCGIPLKTLNVDGGMSANNLLLQIQADIIGITVVRPQNIETTSWGAAVAAGLGCGAWSLTDVAAGRVGRAFHPTVSADERDSRYVTWKRAVQRALGWAATGHHASVSGDSGAHEASPVVVDDGAGADARISPWTLAALGVAVGLLLLREARS